MVHGYNLTTFLSPEVKEGNDLSTEEGKFLQYTCQWYYHFWL
jgi:hypothetical protein